MNSKLLPNKKKMMKMLKEKKNVLEWKKYVCKIEKRETSAILVGHCIGICIIGMKHNTKR